MEDEEPAGERATPLIPNVIQWNLKIPTRKKGFNIESPGIICTHSLYTGFYSGPYGI